MGYEVLVFLAFALVGFTAYVVGGWGPVPVERIRSLLTPQHVRILLVVTAVAVAVVVFVIAVAPLPGERLYTAKGLIRAYAPHAILGLVFGLGFSIWLDQLIEPDALVGTRRHTVHRLWGIALVVLFLGGIFMGPVNRLSSQLTGISTPAVSLTFAGGQHPEDEPNVVTEPSEQSGQGIADSSVARSYFLASPAYFERDGIYVRLLHGDPSEDLKALHEAAQKFVEPIVNCFAAAMKHRESWDDAGAIHTELGPATAAGGAWLRSVLAARIVHAEALAGVRDRDDGLRRLDATIQRAYQATVRKQRSLLATMYSRLPQCRSRPEIREVDPFPREAFELPYFALALAHLMQLAGYERNGAQLLAEWIDQSVHPILADKIPDWYRIRAYIHLSILLAAVGDAVASHAVLEKNVRLFKKALDASPSPFLRDRDRWRKNCASHPDPNIRRLRFAFMTQSNQWIRQALYSDQESARHLSYARINAEIPTTCYAGPLDSFAQRKAEFLTTSGGLLVSLASKGRAIDDDPTAWRDARAYLVEAMALLRPIDDAARGTRLDRRSGAVDAIQPYPVHGELLMAQRYLRRAERTLGMR